MKLLQSFRSLMRLAGPHRGKLVVSAVCGVLAGWIGMIPFALVAAIGQAFLRHDAERRHILALTGWAVGALLARYAFLAAGKLLSHLAAYRTMYDLQLALAKKIGALPLGAVMERGSSTLKKTVLQDTDVAHTLLGHYLSDFLVGLTVPAATLAVFFWVDWRLALAAAAVLPCLYLAYRASFRNYEKELEAYFRADERMQSGLVEYVSGIMAIKTYNRDLSRFLREAVWGQVEQSVLWAERTLKPWSAFNVLPDLSLLFILPVGLWLVVEHRVGFDVLLFFLLLGVGYLQPLVRLSIQIGLLNYAGKSLERIESILNAPALTAAGPVLSPEGNALVLDRVSFSHHGAEAAALEEVSLTIPEGTTCAIVGPSGAGKSTLAQLIGRFWDVESGAITIGGADLRQVEEEELYRRVSFVFQDVFLFRGTVADNLRLAKPEASDAEIVAAAKMARAHEFIMAMPRGYESQVGEKGGFLSGGQKQRLSIARAILRNAPLLILDEATAYADPVNEAEIQKGLRALMKGRTVVMIAHRLSTVVGADQIAVLNRGRLVAAAPHEALLRECPLYASLWRDYSEAAHWHFDEHSQPSLAR
ncbi:MAG: ABC transporter ATP-binding protein [Verrucomicrobium sp.]|nr:ABC transporter ATP-binding protein [Verrucomicrobium sp.]